MSVRRSRAHRTKAAGFVPHDRIRLLDIPRPDPDLVARFAQFPDVAGLVSRALDQLGVAGAIPAHVLAAVTPGRRMIGPAITVRNVPDRFVPFRKWRRREPTRMGEREAYFLASAGDVIVIDGGGRMDASNLGAHSARAAADRGCAGVVVDGPVTGIVEMVATGLPVWARGATTITGNHRVETIEVNGVVACAGVQVAPGDLVVADDQGLAIVPLMLLRETLRICSRQSRVANAQRSTRAVASPARMKQFLTQVTVRP